MRDYFRFMRDYFRLHDYTPLFLRLIFRLFSRLCQIKCDCFIDYFRVSAHWKCECADSYSWPIHAGMTGWCWWRMPAHLHRLEGAQTEWKAAWWSVPVLLYALFFLLYALFVLAEQDCGPYKYVLRNAFLRTPILCVTTSLWNIGEATIGVESAQTVTIILDYFCNYTHYSTTNYSYNSKNVF